MRNINNFIDPKSLMSNKATRKLGKKMKVKEILEKRRDMHVKYDFHHYMH